MLMAGGERGYWGWDGWIASLTQWTWVWASSKRWEGQGSLVCCSPWGCKESDTSQWLNNNRKSILKLFIDWLISTFSTTVCVCLCVSCSVMTNSLWPHGLQPARFFCPWNSPGKNTILVANQPCLVLWHLNIPRKPDDKAAGCTTDSAGQLFSTWAASQNHEGSFENTWMPCLHPWPVKLGSLRLGLSHWSLSKTVQVGFPWWSSD